MTARRHGAARPAGPRGHGRPAAEKAGNRFFFAGFLAAALLIAWLGDAARPFEPGVAAVFVLALAAAARVELWGGSSNGLPSQIVFVPMLLLLPTPLVPLLVAGALVPAKALRAVQGRAALGRSVFAITDAWQPPSVQ